MPEVALLAATMHPVESYRVTAATATQLGIDSLWAPDHLLGFFHPALWPETALGSLQPDPDAWLDPFAVIASIGADSDLRMGICVTDAIRRRAADVARTTLTLHHLCRGGFHLGVGAGEAENLLPFGYDFSTPVGDLEAFLIELRSLLDHGVVASGCSTGRTGLPLSRDDLGAPMVWVGGQGPRLLRLVGQYADGWLPAWPMSPSEYGQKCATIDTYAEDAGRSTPRHGMVVATMLGESRDYVAELLDREPLAKLSALSISAKTWADYGLRHPGGEECRGLVDVIPHELDPDQLRRLAPSIPTELVEESIFLGNAEEILGRVREYVDHGLEYVVLADTTGTAGGLAEIESNSHRLAELASSIADLDLADDEVA